MHRSTRLVLVSTTLLITACGGGRVPDSVHESRSVPASPDKLVKIELGSADVIARVEPSEKITVEMDLEVRASSAAAARRWLERHKPEIEDSDKTLTIHTPSGRQALYLGYFLHARTVVRVKLPPFCRLEASTASGDVELSGSELLSGPVRVTTTSGDVRVDGGARDLLINTTSGDCEVNGPPLDSVQFESSSGDLKLRAAAARLISDTSSGTISAKELTGSASASSSSGDVRATWKSLPAQASITVETSSGEVTLRLPPDSRLRGGLETASGRIRCDFQGTCHRRECLLMTADATNEVKVSTHSGDIHLRALASEELAATPTGVPSRAPLGEAPPAPEAAPQPGS